ncbi:unnamed protein product, partial [Rangifer tarandus platyrhynchus]
NQKQLQSVLDRSLGDMNHLTSIQELCLQVLWGGKEHEIRPSRFVLFLCPVGREGLAYFR